MITSISININNCDNHAINGGMCQICSVVFDEMLRELARIGFFPHLRIFCTESVYMQFISGVQYYLTRLPQAIFTIPRSHIINSKKQGFHNLGNQRWWENRQNFCSLHKLNVPRGIETEKNGISKTKLICFRKILKGKVRRYFIVAIINIL